MSGTKYPSFQSLGGPFGTRSQSMSVYSLPSCRLRSNLPSPAPVPNAQPIYPNPVKLPVFLIPPIAKGQASTPQKTRAARGSKTAPPLASPESHRKRRGTWQHVKGLEKLPGALNPSKLETIFCNSRDGGTVTGYILARERFGLTKDVFVCGERLTSGYSQRGRSDVLELGDKTLCGTVFVSEHALWRHARTAISHIGKTKPCEKCGGMYAARKDSYDRHVSK
jgi:hypothetical protein